MSLARPPGAATLRAPALAICAPASLALAACGREDGEPLPLGLTVPLTDTRGAEDTCGVRSRLGAELAVEEIDKAGDIGRRQLALRVVNGGPPAFEGVAGRVAFDSNGDPVNKQFTLAVIQGGRIVLPQGAR